MFTKIEIRCYTVLDLNVILPRLREGVTTAIP